MTSLNTTTGWDANKQTGSNLTHSNIQGSGKGQTGKDGSLSQTSSHVTPITPVSSTSSSSSAPLLTPGGGAGVGGEGSTEFTSISPSDLDVMRQREIFFRDKYDPMTGVRIASTLGGFFLIVLLTLLYKSKCKGKHSRDPSTLTLTNIGYPPIHPAHLMRGQNIQVNGRHDFGGGVALNGCGGGGVGGQVPVPLTLLDSTSYGYMNQIHPANSHQPVFSNCYESAEGHVKSPAVLLITTTANSESSDEEMFLEQPPHGDVGGAGSDFPKRERTRTRDPSGGMVPCKRKVLSSSEHIIEECQLLHPRAKSPPLRIGAKGNIDINVILPTPSISPSGSENFNMASGPYFGGTQPSSSSNHNPTLSVLPAVRGGVVSGSNCRGENRTLLASRSMSSDNENDNSEMSNCGGDISESSEAPMLPFGCGNFSLFSLDNLKYVDDTSSENIPTRASDAEEQDQDQDTRSIGSDSVFACFDHNFDHIAPTYARRVSSISGASSGALGTCSAGGGASPLPLHRQTLSPSSNNNNLPPPPPPITTTEIMKVNTGQSCDGDEQETEFRVTLTQAQAQVHHRDSFCSDLESVNDYMETGARRRSSSTQTTLSDLRQALGYSLGWPGNSSATKDGASPTTSSLASYAETPRRLSVPRRRRSLSPHLNTNLLSPTTTTSLSPPKSTPPFLSVTLHPPPPPPPQPPSTLPIPSEEPGNISGESESGNTSVGGVTPATPTNPPPTVPSPTTTLSPTSSSSFVPPTRMMRKRSFDAVRKSLSLQCEENTDTTSMYVSSSNETTPTN